MKKYLLTISLICLIAVFCQAQEKKQKKETDKKQETVQFELKNNANPDVYIDGKKYDFEIVDLLDQKKIESVTVVKGEDAIKKYNAPNGVLLIKIKPKVADNAVRIRGTNSSANSDPLVIIDGEESTKDALSKIDPESIESINVIKDEDAEKKYNSPNGVIIVTLKKNKK